MRRRVCSRLAPLFFFPLIVTACDACDSGEPPLSKDMVTMLDMMDSAPDARPDIEGDSTEDLPDMPREAETVCDDDIDNNNDGRPDCADPDCVNAPSCQDVPPSPSTRIKPIAPGASFTLGGLIDAMTSGDDPIQKDADVSQLTPYDVGVIRGQVLNRRGAPVAGARVDVFGQSGLGYTFSRADGMFDFLVPGAGRYQVRIAKTNHPTVYRKVRVEYGGVSWIDDARLTRLADKSDTIEPADGGLIVGPVTQDAHGARQPFVYMPAGTSVEFELEDGARVAAPSTLTIRMTEYTGGSDGLAAMPGELPPTSAYTYAVELSADEALSAGARHVHFDKSVALYVDNFLGFPTGTAVPLGSFEPEMGWVPAPDGVVIKVLSVDGNGVTIDIDGDDMADDAMSLWGMTQEELTALASHAKPGQTYWRATLRHFSPHDLNWYLQRIPEHLRPRPRWPMGIRPRRDRRPRSIEDCDQKGSVINCLNRTVRDKVSVAGTSYDLWVHGPQSQIGSSIEVDAWDQYRISEQAPDFSQRFGGVNVRVTVAGHSYQQFFNPSQSAQTPKVEFPIPQEDAWGRSLSGTSVGGRVTVTYFYDLEYSFTRFRGDESREASFAAYVPEMGQSVRAEGRMFYAANTMDTFVLDYPQDTTHPRLNVHHTYNIANGEIVYGSGQRDKLEISQLTATNVTENCVNCYDPPLDDASQRSTFNAGFASEFWISPSGRRLGYFSGADLFVNGNPQDANSYARRARTVIAEIDDQGMYTVVWSAEPDNTAPLSLPRMKDSDDSVFIVRTKSSQPKSLTIDQINLSTNTTSTIYDTQNDIEQDLPEMRRVHDWAFHPDGASVYILGDAASAQVRLHKVIRQVSLADGKAEDIFSENRSRDIVIDDRSLRAGTQFAIDAQGRLYLVATQDDRVGVSILRMTGMDQFEFFFGKEPGLEVTENSISSELASVLRFVGDLIISPSGVIYALAARGAERGPQIVRITEHKTFAIIGGTTSQRLSCSQVQGQTPNLCYLSGLERMIGVDQEGSVYLASGTTLIKMQGRWPLDPQLGGLLVPGLDHDEFYTFDVDGKHLATYDGHTGYLVRSFEYNDNGQLQAVVEHLDMPQRTTFSWTDGKMSAITGPNNHTTTLTYTGENRLASVVAPDQSATRFEFTDTGLLTERVNPDGGTKSYTYDINALMSVARPQGAGAQQLVQMTEANGATMTTFTDARGLETTYRQLIRDNTSINYYNLLTTYPDGSTTSVNANGALLTLTGRTGMVRTQTAPNSTVEPADDVQKGMLKRTTTTSPSGREIAVTVDETKVLGGTEGAGVVRWSRTMTQQSGRLNAQWRQTYDHATRAMSWRAPNGSITREIYNAQGQPIEQTNDVALLDPTRLQYDADGKLERISRGDVSWSFVWDGIVLSSKTNASGHQHQFTYDDMNRLRTRQSPEQETYTYDYDAMSRLASLTSPNNGVHAWTYNTMGRRLSYTLPGKSPIQWAYTVGDVLDKVTTQDGREIQQVYDNATGQLIGRASPESTIAVTYHPTGQLNTTTRTMLQGGKVQEVYTYDGDLLMQKASTFDDQDTYNAEWTYDALWRVTNVRVAGQDMVIERDLAGMPTQIGDWRVVRDGPGKGVSEMRRGNVVQRLQYDRQGFLIGRELALNQSPIYSYVITPNNAGHAQSIVERVGSQTVQRSYTYDDNGRVLSADLGDGQPEQYAWDANSNPVSFNGATATYDQADEITSWSTMTVQHNTNGQISQMGSWQLTYDAQGMLIEGVHADGRRVTLSWDAMGRLASRSRDNQTHRFLYHDLANPFLVTHIVQPNGVISHYIYDEMQHLMEIRTGSTSYLVGTDNVGSPRVLTTLSGNAVKRLRYTAFGERLEETGAAALWIGFAGGLRDPDLPVLSFGFRHYAPQLGRWVTRDPAGIQGSPNNLYGYVMGNPVTHRDPSGLACVGGSFYAGVGGGGSVCFDMDNGFTGVCLELGFGLGGGLDVQPLAKHPGNVTEIEANIKLGAGPVALDGGFKLNSCGEAQLGANFNVGPIQIPLSDNLSDTKGSRAIDLPEGDLKNVNPNGKDIKVKGLTVGVEGKIAGRQCRKF